ncbi:glycosyltransferase [Schaalia sp. 19OD2882]|uniref:glycosyltransferase n=1 Tax=Schaalia sp. 19OD2882 TaxID=2794089 RepID=UPI001C1EB5EE|nr:glycosyltransferase [Schaalia sp. 19OD2882]QWW19007.1 glycosyltransferase [Schaalia sp. 19OD2882]
MTRIGYVLKVYPRFSETFVVTEILARQAQGEDLRIFALRPTRDTHFHPEISRVRAPVRWIARPHDASTFWELIGPMAAEEPLRSRLAQILPDLATLPASEVAQGIMLARAALEDGITHLHAHFASLAGRVAWIASRLSGIPFTVTTHAKDIHHRDVDIDWLRRIAGGAARVIAISRFNEEHLRRILADTRARIDLCRNALELERFPHRQPEGPHRPLRVVAVGRLVRKKGFPDLVEASRVLRERGVVCRVEIAGEGEQRQELEALIASGGLQDRVRLLGPLTQDKVRELLEGADVFVAPCVVAEDGNVDGLPTVVLEAMAVGTPVIATSVTGLPEVVRSDTGILLPPGDPASLANALEKVARGEVDLRALSRGARSMIETEYDSVRQARVLAAWESPEAGEAS